MLGEAIMWILTGLVVAVGFGVVLVLVLRALVTGRFMSTGDVREAQLD
jgi:hypothetical protein